jgi:maleylacetoacetate isomerase
VLESEHGLITQSLAIIEYLEERHPEPPLLPRDPGDRARARALALAIAAEIHPIQNLRVLNHLRETCAQNSDGLRAWAQYWIEGGLAAFQTLLGPATGRYCRGDRVNLPDVLLAPQMVNARRFRCNFASLGRLVEIDAALRELPAFRDTAPPPQSS